MKVIVTVTSYQLTKEDLRVLLQAIRDCEMATFPQKEIYISAEVPELSVDDMRDLLASITPAYEYGPLILKHPEEKETH